MPEKKFRAGVRLEGGIPVIDLAGDINAGADGDLDAAFTQAKSRRAPAVLLNFRDVTYINSTGIALIVGLLAQARKDHVQVLVCGLNDHYRHIFNITRLADFMSIHEDEPAALAQATSTAAE
jgi:anti-anti-sigma factor